MAEDEEAANAEAGAEGEEAEGGKKKSKLPLIVGGVVALLLIGGGAAFFLGLFGGAEPETVTTESGVVIDNTPSVYFDLPEMVVNLASGREKAQYLKLKVAIEAQSQDYVDALQPKMPNIQDMFQIYLREMRREDLEGSAAVYRLKQELTRRINIAIHPAKIKRVLFKEIIIQ